MWFKLQKELFVTTMEPRKSKIKGLSDRYLVRVVVIFRLASPSYILT